MRSIAKPREGHTMENQLLTDPGIRQKNKEAALGLLNELIVLLTCNAANLIEQDDHAFDEVRPRAGHHGSKSRKIDIDNSNLAQSWSRRARVLEQAPLGGIHLESEESTHGFDPGAYPHPMVIQLDEFDGTTIATGAATNWSTAGLAFVYEPKYEKYVLAAGSIGLPDGHLVDFLDRTSHRVLDGSPNVISRSLTLSKFDTYTPRAIAEESPIQVKKLYEITECPSDGAADMVAVSAAAGTIRYAAVENKFPRLMREAKFKTLCAGTPIVYAAIRSQIGMIVDPEPSTLHDATHLFPLNAIGWRTLNLDTQEDVPLIEIAEAYATEDASLTPLPPTVSYRNESALRLLGW
jgi:hypothetical protein